MPRGQVRRRIRARNYRAARRDRKEKKFMFGNKKKVPSKETTAKVNAAKANAVSTAAL
jgi:hypothetical protein